MAFIDNPLYREEGSRVRWGIRVLALSTATPVSQHGRTVPYGTLRETPYSTPETKRHDQNFAKGLG